MDTLDIAQLERECGCRQPLFSSRYDLPPEAFAPGKCASETIAAALASHSHVTIPKTAFPLLLDRPIVLSSGQHLSVHPETALRLQPGCGGCMLRNANPADGRMAPYPAEKQDHDILVEGGIWELAGSGISPNDTHPVMRAFAESSILLLGPDGKPVNPAGREGGGGILLGVIFFSNARNITIRGLAIRRCNFYGILLAGNDCFLVEDIKFDHNKMDGVHVNGPSGYGIVQRITGKTGDDFVALNAWDWYLSAVSFGAIHHILVRDLLSEGDELRLLPGRKRYADGTAVECPIHDCCLTGIRNIYCVKLYQQPNCVNEIVGICDKSEIPGTIERVEFRDLWLEGLQETGLGEVRLQALFEVCADCRDLRFEDIWIAVSQKAFAEAGLHLVEVGTKSSTWKRGFQEPEKWVELFDTELDCTAERLHFRNITFSDRTCRDAELLAHAHSLTPNPDYPKTTPRGGHGIGTVRDIVVEP